MRKCCCLLLFLFFITNHICVSQVSVDLLTGAPRVSIPIYNFRSNDLQLPVGLGYNPGAVRNDNSESWVGMGWSLNPGGFIGREVKDIPDDIDLSEAYLSNKSVSNSFSSDKIAKQVKSPLLEALERINFETEFYPGLTREEIDEIAQDIPFTFPEELYELYQWHNGVKERKGWDYCFAGTSEFLSLQEAIDFTRVIAEGEYNEDSWKPNYFCAFAEGTDNGYLYVLTIDKEKATVLDYCPDSMIATSIEFSSITQMMLEKAFWQKADFSEANLAGVDLNGFYLRNIKFNGSNFEKANLSKADLEGAVLKGANLKDANLYQAKITNTDFTDAIFCNTIMPNGSIRNN